MGGKLLPHGRGTTDPGKPWAGGAPGGCTSARSSGPDQRALVTGSSADHGKTIHSSVDFQEKSGRTSERGFS